MPIIYLSPSTQEWNYYVNGGTEEEYMNLLADKMVPYLDASGIRPYFKGIFISEEVGADKPSKAFFGACFAAIPGFRPEDAVMVGDSLTSDIRGGRNAGLRTVWFNPHGKEPRADIRPDCTIHALPELPALLTSMQ